LDPGKEVLMASVLQLSGPGSGPPSSDPVELLARYRDHLVRERGLAASTVAGYQTVARQFLGALTEAGDQDLTRLSARFVTEFVVDSAERRPSGPRSIG
jgi:site-specific recombinase XerC